MNMDVMTRDEGRNPSATTPLLPRDETAEYLRLHAQLKAPQSVLVVRLNELHDKLLALLVQSYRSPPDLPGLLINRPQARKERDWEAVALEAIRQLVKLGAEDQIAAIEAAWPTKEVPSLVVILNPDFVVTG